jgi:cardiolipin synthase
MKADLQQAEHFIFMEYFILEDGAAFEALRRILRERAAAGVEVRILYDDFGSIGSANLHFARELSKDGIQCQVFNPAVPVLNLFMNHRDHRKITVIDGKVGYTGGYNLSDEYFDITRPYGHWKDLGLRLEGEAVAGLTRIFLELWRFSSRRTDPAEVYLQARHSLPGEDGYVQPFSDSPVGTERVTENVYLNLVNSAREYVWFMTPYLIITDEMIRALQLAAKRGIDVRIVTPGIPDKKMVYALTRSYYSALASHGVRIYEYSPGFCHGKLCVCDGKLASIGTSNLDYRSLYLHFENNVLLYDCQAVRDMAEDLRNTFPQCREVTEAYRGPAGFLRLWQCMLRLFAPLM